MMLDLDDWFSHSDPDTLEKMFTVRLSWPASNPANFKMSLHSPLSLNHILKVERPPIPPHARNEMVDEEMLKRQQLQARPLTRSTYLRIRASTTQFVRAPHPDGGVLPFQHQLFPSWFLPAPKFKEDEETDVLRFHIILEPLLLGVLPQSLVPGLTFLGFLLLIAGFFVVPRVLSIFERLADRVRKGKGKLE